jgi:uncharacterized protein YjaG (DUF416 family)
MQTHFSVRNGNNNYRKKLNDEKMRSFEPKTDNFFMYSGNPAFDVWVVKSDVIKYK